MYRKSWWRRGGVSLTIQRKINTEQCISRQQFLIFYLHFTVHLPYISHSKSLSRKSMNESINELNQ